LLQLRRRSLSRGDRLHRRNEPVRPVLAGSTIEAAARDLPPPTTGSRMDPAAPHSRSSPEAVPPTPVSYTEAASPPSSSCTDAVAKEDAPQRSPCSPAPHAASHNQPTAPPGPGSPSQGLPPVKSTSVPSTLPQRPPVACHPSGASSADSGNNDVAPDGVAAAAAGVLMTAVVRRLEGRQWAAALQLVALGQSSADKVSGSSSVHLQCARCCPPAQHRGTWCDTWLLHINLVQHPVAASVVGLHVSLRLHAPHDSVVI
jgi:hypothetical protein